MKKINLLFILFAFSACELELEHANPLDDLATWAEDIPLIETGGANFITTSSAILKGEIMGQGMSSVTKYGHCWSTSTSPTISANTLESSGGSTIDTFSTLLTGLSNNTKYYYRAYAENNQGLAYGLEQSFSTTNGEPTVITGGISNISTTNVTLGGVITGEGDAAITEYGHCWSTSPDPNINNSQIMSNSNGTTGTIITSNLTSLSVGTIYYYKAYATNWFGTSYGEQNTFTTSDGSPIVETVGAQFESFSSWTGGCDYTFTGEIMSYGSAPITGHGVAFSKSNTEPSWGAWASPTIQDGIYTVTYDDIDLNQTYYYRAYAENAIGTSYGDTYSFRSPEWCYISNTSTSGAPNITTSLNSSNTEVTVTIIGWGNDYVDNVYFYRNNNFLENLGDNVLFTNGQRTFTLPSGLDVSDCYTIQISDGNNMSILMVSDPFTVE